MKSPPEPQVQIQNNLAALFLMMPSISNCTNCLALLNKRASRALDKKYLCAILVEGIMGNISVKPVVQVNKVVTRALDKKYY